GGGRGVRRRRGGRSGNRGVHHGPFGRNWLFNGGRLGKFHGIDFLAPPGHLGGALGRGQDAQRGAVLVGQVVQGQAAEDVVHHRAGQPDVRVVGQAGRLEPHVGEFGHVRVQ